MLLPCCFDLNQSKVLDVREPCNLLVLDVIEPCLFSFGSWCYSTYHCIMVLDVIEPWII